MTIKVKIFGILGLILLLTGGGIGMAVIQLKAQGPELVRTENQVRQVSESAVPLLVTIKEIKADVIQVQGWLTDISATRGLPNFDDGFAEAEAFAKKFTNDVELARNLATKLGMQGILKALDELETAFPPFYAGGKKMAQAYVDAGPEAGNPQMEVFDNVAETMGEATDKLVKLVEEATSSNMSDLQSLAKNVREDNESLVAVLIVLSLVAAVVMVAGVLVLYKTITNSFSHLNADVEAVMSDSTSIVLNLSPDQQDEFGPVAAALFAFQDNKIRASQAAEEQKKARDAQAARSSKLEELAAEFDGSVRGFLGETKLATDTMKSSADGMVTTAEQTTQQATAVTTASEEASTNVQTVASAAEELSSSIHEISRQVTQSSDIASKAVDDAANTNEKIQGLAAAANKVGEVVNLITDIADQTNLLALNATIEAARAGESGKGFAVVASEVKNLANQTAKATEEIDSQINNIQNATQEAVEAIQGISKTIGEIQEIGSAIAAAVEEQGSATKEIARNVEQAAAGTNEVSSNISGVNQAATETGQSAIQVLDAVETLTIQSDNVSEHVGVFLKDIKAI